METEYGTFDIVRVVSGCRLLDAGSQERVYWRRNGQPLAEGYYVVIWPPGTVVRRFNEDAEFRGPYPQRETAQAALEQLKARFEARRAVAARRPGTAAIGPVRGNPPGERRPPK